MRIAVTGGTGFVGGSLVSQLSAAGHEAAPFARDGVSLEGYDVLIHGGWDFAASDDRNIVRAQGLFDAAVQANTRIIFISTLSAFPGCRSFYGKTKLTVEEHAIARGGCGVRLGFVCDPTGRGLSGALKKLAALPVLPLPGGGKQNLFAIDSRDLGRAFLTVMECCRAEVVSLAHPAPIPLRQMMRTIAELEHRSPLFFSIPWRSLWVPLRIAELAGLGLKFRSDSLVSLMNQNPSPNFRMLKTWGISLRNYPEMLR